MASFDDIYKQTITLFNRAKVPDSDDSMWIPTVIEGVHLVTTSSSAWNTRGERETDDIRLHIRYSPSQKGILIPCKGADGGIVQKKWYEPKAWRKLAELIDSTAVAGFATAGVAAAGETDVVHGNLITFAFGDTEAFDFFMEGVYENVEEPILDADYERRGFYNYMNANYDNVFAITSVAKYNLIPHFEIMAR